MRIRPWLILAAAPLLLAAAPEPVSAPVSLGFWVREGATPAHPAMERVEEDGPCGPVARLKVSSVPDFKPSDPLMAEEAMELDGKGAVLRRWRLPVDYTVSAVSGDWMLAAYAGKSDPYWFDLSGRIGAVSAADAKIATVDDSVRLVDCPAGAKVPEGMQCLSVPDLSRQARRVIAAHGVCS